MLNIDDFKSANLAAFIKYIEAVEWGYANKELEHKKYLNKFNNFIFVLANYSSCGYSENTVTCKINKITKEYMSCCSDLNETQIENIIKRVLKNRLTSSDESVKIINSSNSNDVTIAFNNALSSISTNSVPNMQLSWTFAGGTWSPAITFRNTSWESAAINTGTSSIDTASSTFAVRKNFDQNLQYKGMITSLGVKFANVAVGSYYTITTLTTVPSQISYLEGSVVKTSTGTLKPVFRIDTSGNLQVKFILLTGTYPVGTEIISDVLIGDGKITL
jgi:hypothetical protein